MHNKNKSATTFDPKLANIALAKGIIYLKIRLAWSDIKITNILHFPDHLLTTWLKNGEIPFNETPTIQALIHLLAIHRHLEAMFTNPTHQQLWLSTYHPELNASPEAIMSESIDGVISIRQYLDIARSHEVID